MSYDFEWHARHGERTEKSARIVLQSLSAILPFKSVLDVGCGDGRWLEQSTSLGAETILGIDGAWTDKTKLLVSSDQVLIKDLEKKFRLDRKFDLAITLEVAEHLNPEAAETFVDNLIRHSDVVLFGAAIPYQGGFRHINERWQSYWAGLFEERNYEVFDPFRNGIWNDENVHYWYKQNMLLYVNRERADLTARVSDFIKNNQISQLPIDIVHPEKYEALASYDQIAFKPLLSKLPSRAAEKAYSILMRKE